MSDAGSGTSASGDHVVVRAPMRGEGRAGAVGGISLLASLFRDAVSFAVDALGTLSRGNRGYYLWMVVLSTGALMGAAAYIQQYRYGFAITSMSDHVSWGAYIANFTFTVGLTDGSVIVAFVAFVFGHKLARSVMFLSLYAALAALVMALAFVMADIGRPERFWHMMPVVGEFNFPVSMLSWDVVALSGYLGINGIIVVWALFSWYRGGQVPMRLLKPCIYLSMAWGVFAHTVTAFLYSWVAARPFWNSAVMAPRFIASAFIVGPVFLVVSLQVIRKVTAFEVRDEVIHTLRKVIAVSALVNLFLLVSEVFSETYSGAHHGAPILYLFRGLVGSTLLVPFLWVAVISNVVAFVIFATPPLARRFPILNVGCALAFLGVWIEKGMGLIVPGFVPSPTGEVIEYIPSLVEFLVSLGIACLGMLVFTSLIKVGVPLELRAGGSPGTGSLKREVEP